MRVSLAIAAVLLGGWAQPASRPDGDSLLVLHKGANSLGFYDRASGRVLAAVPVGEKPHEMALTADGRFAIVTNYGVGSYTDASPGGNTLSIVDVRERWPEGTIDLGPHRRPHGIVRGSSGRFFITTDRPAAVLVVDAAARRIVEQHPIAQPLPHMVAVTRDERVVFTANAGGGTITQITRNAGRSSTRDLRVGGVPMGLALTGDDRTLYVATRDANEVVAVDTGRFEVIRRISVAGGPARVQLTPDERRLVVSLIQAGEAAIVEAASGRLLARAPVGAAAEGIAIDRTGTVAYVSAQGANAIAEIRLSDAAVTRRIETAATPDPMILLEPIHR